MKQSVKDAHRTIRNAREYATRTSDARLHVACACAIDAMVADGLLMPSKLRAYAKHVRLLYGFVDGPGTTACTQVARE